MHGKILSQGIPMWNIKALALTVQKLLARSRRHGKNIWYFQKVLVTKNINLKGLSTHCSKAICKVKVLKIHVQGHMVKKLGTHGQALSHGILM